MCALGNHEQLDRLVLQQEAGVRLPLLQHRREPNGFEAKRSSHPVKVEARRAGTPRREALPKWGGTVDLGVFVQRVASPELRVFEEQVLEIAKVLAIGDSGSRDRVLRMREHVKDVKASAAEADEAHSRPINNTKAV